MNRIILLFSFLFIFIVTHAQTFVPGGLVSGTWTISGSPYLVQGAILVADGTTLTIEPGVRVEFQGAYKFLLLGQIIAVGTQNDSITFTATDTTTGWLGIRFDSTLANNDTSRFSYCKFQYGNASGTASIDRGGALYFRLFSKAIISNCRISNCYATVGGGIFCDRSNPLISNNFIANNTSYTAGAGIFNFSSQPIISNNIFVGNIATETYATGGAINLDHCVNAVVDNNLFIENSAGRGGCIFVGSGDAVISNNIGNNNIGVVSPCIALEFSNPTISGNSFTNNTGGGIIWVEGTDPHIYDNDLSNNDGFGIVCSINSGNNIPVITNNIINGNSKGGISCNYSAPIVANNFITNNHKLNGGAISCTNTSNVMVISNNVIANNTADSTGGAIYCNNSSPTLLNNTIVNNQSMFGGGIFCKLNSDPVSLNNIITGNASSIEGNQIYLYDESSDPNITYTDLEGGSLAIGVNTNVFFLGTYANNFDLFPNFYSPSTGCGNSYDGLNADWHLMANSPCIDAGSPAGTYPAMDLDGNPRVVNGVIDIGAYESLSVGLHEFANNVNVSVFPNPSASLFKINVNSKNKFSEFILRVIDVQGRVLIEQQNVNVEVEYEIGVGLPLGIYELQLLQNDVMIRTKMVKI